MLLIVEIYVRILLENMAAIRPSIDPYKCSDGSRRIRYRISHLGRSAYVATPYRVYAHELTARGAIRSTLLKNIIAVDMEKANAHLRQLGLAVRRLTAQEIAKRVKRAIDAAAGLSDTTIDFIEFAEQLAARKQRLQPETAKNYLWTVSAIKKYTLSDRLPFDRITRRWLLGFENYLYTKERPVGQSTVASYMRRIRAIYNEAQAEYNDEESGYCAIPFNPFLSGKYRIPSEVTQTYRTIDIPVIRAIRDYRPTTQREELAQDVFLLSLYLMGMNLPDMFECRRRNETRLEYRRQKVGRRVGANAVMSVNVPPEAQPIIEKYADPSHERVFDFYRRYSDMTHMRAAVNKGLASICKAIGEPPVTYYYARHAFALIAHQLLGVSLEDIGRCLDHSSTRKSVTFRYAGHSYARNDEIQRGVIDVVNSSQELHIY